MANLGMSKEEYLEFHRAFCARMIEVTTAKNADYTGGDPDPFANFKMVEKMGVCSTETGFLTRMSDKFIRISNLIDREAQVKDESIADTLHDLANYCALFAAYLQSKRSGSDRHDVATEQVREVEASPEVASLADVGDPAGDMRTVAGGGTRRLETGKSYLRRDGKLRTIKRKTNIGLYTHEDSAGGIYTADGKYWDGSAASEEDLVEEVSVVSVPCNLDGSAVRIGREL